DVELLVVGAIERAHGRLAHAAGRTDLPVVEHQCRRAVFAVRLLEDPAPDLLGAAQDLGDELAHLIPRSAFGDFLLGGVVRNVGNLLPDVDRGAGIEAEEIGDDGDDDAADAQPSAHHASHAAPVFDVAACLL